MPVYCREFWTLQFIDVEYWLVCIARKYVSPVEEKAQNLN